MKKKLLSICGVLCCLLVAISCGCPKNVSAATSPVEISSKSACLLDFSTGEVLFENNSDQKYPVASMVKLMTILLTFESLNNSSLALDEKVLTSENASGMGGSQVFIDPYVEYTVEDLLKSVIVASANDASVALAEKISGSESAFVSKMNERAKQLGMNNTNYVNSTGLPAPEQYSSAKDISILNRELLKHNDYHNYSTIWMDKLVHPSGRETELVNTNKLIRYYKGCDSGKTGSTDEAGYCLSASCLRNDMRLISTIVGAVDSKTRFNEVSALFNYGYANFENKQVISKEAILLNIPTKRSSVKEINVYAEEDFFGLSKKGDNSTFDVSYECPDVIKSPVKNGDQVGKIIITKNGQVVAELNAISGTEANKYTFKESLSEVLSSWAL